MPRSRFPKALLVLAVSALAWVQVGTAVDAGAAGRSGTVTTDSASARSGVLDGPEPSDGPRIYSRVDPDRIAMVAEKLGDRFGGVWVEDDAGDPVLGIGVVSPSVEETEAVSRLLGSDSVRVRPVPYSRSELIKFHRRITEALRGEDTSSSVKVGLRTDLNRVEIDMAAVDAAVLDRVTVGIPSDAVATQLREEPLSAELVPSRQSYPPYKAGLDIIVISNEWVLSCTSAVTMLIEDGPNAGLRQGLTAGHCGEVSNTAHAGPGHTSVVGVTNRNSFYCCQPTAIGDSQLIGFVNQTDASNWLIVSSTFQRLVTGRVLDSAMGVGANLCKSAKTTGITCGDITEAPPVTITDVRYFDVNTGSEQEKDITNLACFDADSDFGDSGGPIYNPTLDHPEPEADAAGVLSLKITDGSGTTLETCFDTIENVERTTDTTVFTGGGLL